jgi:hypothetical protein
VNTRAECAVSLPAASAFRARLLALGLLLDHLAERAIELRGHRELEQRQ